MSDNYLMTTILLVGAAGVGLIVWLAAYQGRQRRTNHELAERIERVLRDGERSLPEIIQALGMGGFDAHATVGAALDEMINAGRVTRIPAPEGTPDVEKVKRIKYRLNS